MYSNHIMYQPYSSRLRLLSQENGDELKIKSTQSVWHPEMHELILFLDLSKDPGSNISGHLNGNRLLLETAPGVSYNKPLRTHLVGPEFMDEIEEGFIPVSFLELKLKDGYRYNLKSCQICGTNRIKVILGFKKRGK